MRGFEPPQLLADLYRDLRDRRLLTVVIGLLCAAVLIPIALSSSPSPPPPLPPSADGALTTNPAAPAVKVVAATPGLRDYRRRLRELGAKDPFGQKFVAPRGLAGTDLGGSGLGESVAAQQPPADSGASAATGASSSQPGIVGGSPGGEAAPPGQVKFKTKTRTETKYVSFRIKVKTGELGGEMQVRDMLGSLALLPSDLVPALAYLGSDNVGKALFMVSSDVSAISGDGACVMGTSACQLLILRPGQHEDLVWSDGKTYRVTLVKIAKFLRNKPSH
jgi:hypothetical protein